MDSRDRQLPSGAVSGAGANLADPSTRQSSPCSWGRSTPEWIGKTPDTPVPDKVKLRVFRRYDGICHISGRKIRAGEPWDADHVKALCNGGENRESNLKPALRDKHREKTADDVAEKADTDAKAMKNLGLKKSKTKWPKRTFAQQRWAR